MAKIYSIQERLQGGKPLLELADGVSFPINNSLAAAVAIKAAAEEKGLDDIARLEKIATIAFGADAVKDLQKRELALPDWLVIVNVIMAALQGQELEDVEQPAGKQAPPASTS